MYSALLASRASLQAALITLDLVIAAAEQQKEDEEAEAKANHPSRLLHVINNNMDGVETMGQSDE